MSIKKLTRELEKHRDELSRTRQALISLLNETEALYERTADAEDSISEAITLLSERV